MRPRLALGQPQCQDSNLLAVQLVASQGMALPTSPPVQMHQSHHHWFAGAGKACSAGQSCEQAWWGSLDMWAGRSGPQVCTGSGSLHAPHGGVRPLLSLSHMHKLLSRLLCDSAFVRIAAHVWFVVPCSHMCNVSAPGQPKRCSFIFAFLINAD